MRYLALVFASAFARRLAYALAVAVLAMLAGQCHAHGALTGTPAATTGHRLYGPANGVQLPWAPTKQAACEAGTTGWMTSSPSVNVLYSITWSGASPNDGACSYVAQRVSDGYLYGASTASIESLAGAYQPDCVANAAVSGGTCYCNVGYKPDGPGTACTPVGNCSTVLEGLVSGWGENNYLVTPNMDVVQCVGGCEIRGAFTVRGPEGTYMAQPQATGGTCQGTSNTGTTVEPHPSPVPPGKCPGTVNDEPVIVDCTDSTTGSDTKVNKPDGGTEHTTSETRCTQANGCTTTVTSVSCSASAVCSTTTTVTQGHNSNANAGGLGAGGGGGDDTDFCATNPNRAGCKDLGSAAGDAVAGVNRTISITPDEGWSHDDTCPADKVLNLAAVTLTVPFTLLCTAADYARPIVIAVAWISAIGGFFGLARKGD